MEQDNKAGQGYHDTRTRIFMVTLELIRKKSGQNVTVADICKESGVTKSTFYYHYRSVDDVIDSVNELLKQRISDSLPKILLEKTCVDQILMTFQVIHREITEFGAPIAACRYILQLKRKEPKNFPRTEPGWELLHSLFIKALEVGELHSSLSPDELTDTCFYIIRGVCITWCMQNGDFDLIQNCRRQLEQFLRAMRS